MSYDPQCHDLAVYFTYDNNAVTVTHVRDLAQQIQDCIERWQEEFDRDRAEALEAAKDKAAGI
jgi:hypothetical protein